MAVARADVILHPVRIRIIQRLATEPGHSLTARQLGPALPEVPQASLYRHLNRLEAAGVLRVAPQAAAARRGRGAPERVYQLADAWLQWPDLNGTGREEHLQYFTTFVGLLLGDFARYLQCDSIDFARDGVGYRQFALQLSDREFAEFTGRLAALIGSFAELEPAPERTSRLLTTILMPGRAPQE